MRKASVARVDLDRHPPQLQWLIDPRMARHLRQRAKEFAAEDFAKVIALFAQRPKFQFRPGAPRLHFQVNALGIDARRYPQHVRARS